jgi:hypothetical protein
MRLKENPTRPARRAAVMLGLLLTVVFVSLTIIGRASSNPPASAPEPRATALHAAASLGAEPAILILLGCGFVLLGRTLKSGRQSRRDL